MKDIQMDSSLTDLEGVVFTLYCRHALRDLYLSYTALIYLSSSVIVLSKMLCITLTLDIPELNDGLIPGHVCWCYVQKLGYTL
jgi:hypothetical protein